MNSSADHTTSISRVNAARVMRRALVLAAVVCRGNIESGAGNPEAELLHRRILAWLSQLALWEEAEEKEEQILRAPIGTLDRKVMIQATWYVEGLAILAWALNLHELPPHDQQVDPYEVTDALGFLSEEVHQWILTSRLRKKKELVAYEEIQYDIHVRLRDFIRHRTKMDFRRWVENSEMRALGMDTAHLIIDDDLAIDDKPIGEAEEDRIQECASIAFERHRALLWLLGRDPIYAHTPVDT